MVDDRPATAPVAAARPSALAIAVVGATAGFLSGLFGVGGGVVIVPGLVWLARMPQRLAHGTSLAAIIPISLGGIGGFLLDDKVDWAVAGLLVIGSVVGARIGTWLLHVVSAHRLRMTFAVALLLTAVRLVITLPDTFGRADIDLVAALLLVATGLVGGGVAGLLGVGGGVVLVPAQVLLFDVADEVAKATSLAVILPTALVGTVANARRGNADLRAATIVGLSGVATAFAASRIAIGLDPVTSNLLFSLLLSLVSLRLLMQRRGADE